jgi:hypothetical protein
MRGKCLRAFVCYESWRRKRVHINNLLGDLNVTVGSDELSKTSGPTNFNDTKKVETRAGKVVSWWW